jgi:hypothetical protein
VATMILKADVLAALDGSLRRSDRSSTYVAFDAAARVIVHSMFEGREQMTLIEAQGVNSILTLACCGLLGAMSTAYCADDVERHGDAI